MLRHARLADRVRLTGTALAAAARGWAAWPAARRKKSLVIAGTTLALVGVGSATAATATASAPAATHAAAVRAPRATGTARPPLARGHVLTAQSPRPVATQQAPAPASTPATNSWDQVTASFSGPATPTAAAQLTPVGTSGSQGSMPISGAQYANATTIVQQVKARKMGIRSAVIAIATAMQESQLQNLPYGTGDALGLFQQQPSSGWGTPQQILNPAYATNAFLTALQQHQQADPSWASEPLWATAQSVQASGFPTAYAQWETEAAAMVKVIATSLG